MNFQTFRLKAKNYPFFRYVDVLKWFPDNNEQTIKQNLKFWVKKESLERITKGVYKLKETEIKEEFLLASYLDENSYISLESALSFYGMIPEFPYSITSVTRKKTKKIKTNYGVISYRKIQPDLFFGFELMTDNDYVYRLATPEKALFDYMYLNQREIQNADYFKEMRLSLPQNISWKKLTSLLSLLKKKVIISYFKIYVNRQ